VIYLQNSIFDAKSCHLDFELKHRLVRLTFEDSVRRLIVRTTEADMASLMGRFIKERLFGLH